MPEEVQNEFVIGCATRREASIHIQGFDCRGMVSAVSIPYTSSAWRKLRRFSGRVVLYQKREVLVNNIIRIGVLDKKRRVRNTIEVGVEKVGGDRKAWQYCIQFLKGRLSNFSTRRPRAGWCRVLTLRR